MREILFNRLGVISVIVGFLYCSIYLLSHFFISYFSSVGIKEWFSPFCLFLLLILAGVLLILKKNLGLFLLNGFIVGIIIERIAAFIFYHEYVSYFNFIFPIFIGFSFGYILYFSKYSKYLKCEAQQILVILITVLILFIIIFPKLYL